MLHERLFARVAFPRGGVPLELCSMADYRHIEVSRNGAVYVAKFLEHKILNDMVIEGIAPSFTIWPPKRTARISC